jgi:hypothetical protein
MGLDQIICFRVAANPSVGALNLSDLQTDLASLNMVPAPPAPLLAPGNYAAGDRALVIRELDSYVTNPEANSVTNAGIVLHANLAAGTPPALFLTALPHVSHPAWNGISFLDRDTSGSALGSDADPGLIWGEPLIETPMVSGTDCVNAVLTPSSGGPLVTPSDQRVLQTASGAQWEIWELWNVSLDVHPIHLHHTQFLVLERWTIDTSDLDNLVVMSGSQRPADPNEQGWKDTVRSAAGEMVRLAVRFDDGSDPAHDYTGNYVMHCHLLDHEDMGMMRPLRID